MSMKCNSLSKHKLKSRFLEIPALIGVVIEFYDFTLYGIFSQMFAYYYFPPSANDALLISLGVFAVGFIARPVGAIIFGHIADVYGRKKSLILSLLLMSVSTITIGFLPTYQVIGILATFMLIMFRILQGISAGGEYGTSAVFLIEHSYEKTNIGGNVTVCAAIFGSLLAMFSGFLFNITSEILEWRLFFIAGGLFSLLGLFFRTLLTETKEFESLVKRNKILNFPIYDILFSYPLKFFVVIVTGGYAGAMAYFLSIFCNVYLGIASTISSSTIQLIVIAGLICFMLFSYLTGILSKKVCINKIMIVSSFSTIFLSFLIFYFLQSNNLYLILFSVLVLGGLGGSYGACYFLFASKLFPTNIRCTAISFGHGIGLALLGGSFPMIALSLIRTFDSYIMPAFYLSCLSILGFISVASSTYCKKENVGRIQIA